MLQTTMSFNSLNDEEETLKDAGFNTRLPYRKFQSKNGRYYVYQQDSLEDIVANIYEDVKLLKEQQYLCKEE